MATTLGKRDPTMPAERISECLASAQVALERVRLGRSSKGILILGGPGSGKLHLLGEIQLASVSALVLNLDGSSARSFPAQLASQMKAALRSLTPNVQEKGGRLFLGEERAEVRRAMLALSGFSFASSRKYPDVEVEHGLPTEEGVADSGDLDSDLGGLFDASCEAVRAAGGVFLLCVSDMHLMRPKEMSALLGCLHHAAANSLPIAMVGTGLPELRGMVGESRSYAERMFSFWEMPGSSAG